MKKCALGRSLGCRKDLGQMSIFFDNYLREIPQNVEIRERRLIKRHLSVCNETN